MQPCPTTAARPDYPWRRSPESERPWGGFEQFVHNEAVTVKIITVAPLSGSRSSATHSGTSSGRSSTAPLTSRWRAKASSVDAGGRAWIPRGSTHRLGNSGTAAVRVLEIAFGHFDEDDIERLVDDYNRVTDPTLVAAAGPGPILSR